MCNFKGTYLRRRGKKATKGRHNLFWEKMKDGKESSSSSGFDSDSLDGSVDRFVDSQESIFENIIHLENSIKSEKLDLDAISKRK